MGNAEAVHRQFTHFEGGTRRKHPKVRPALNLLIQGLPGEPIAVNRHIQLGGQRGQALDMIGMFMGDQDAGQCLRGPPDGRQSLPDLPSAKPGINQNTGFATLQIGTVATRTTTENRQSSCHVIESYEQEIALATLKFMQLPGATGCLHSTANPTRIKPVMPPPGSTPRGHPLKRLGLFLIGSCLLTGSIPVAAQVSHVIHISVDGLRSDGVTALTPDQLPNFYRLRREGMFTDNARTDPDVTWTLPNHTGQLTGRNVLGPDGHQYTRNSQPARTETLHSSNPDLDYISSVFDVAHDHGLSTALFAGKSKFALYKQSYNEINGAPDLVGEDNGRDKIDLYWIEGNTSALVAAFRTAMENRPYHYSFVHLTDPDSIGHSLGWASEAWFESVRAVDTYLGALFELIDNTPSLRDQTAVILTADHGGVAYNHGEATDPLVYTIPFYVWGPGVGTGTDLYMANLTGRRDPGSSHPESTDPLQPIRNSDAANLALNLLGLGPVPGSATAALATTVDPGTQPPVIIGHPVQQSVSVGQSVELRVEARAAAPIQYQWFHENVPIQNAQDARLRIDTVEVTDAGDYRVTVSAAGSSTTSHEARLIVTAKRPAKSDFDGDGYPDIVFAGSTGDLAIWHMQGTTRRGTGFLFPNRLADPQWSIVGSGDFNSDGREDLVFQHTDGTLALWLMNRVLLEQSVFPTPNHPGDKRWRVVGVTDFDRDGSSDLLFQHENGELAAWLLHGTQLASAQWIQPTHPGDPRWHVRAVADFNRDANPDILFQHEDGRLVLWTMVGLQLSQAVPLRPDRVDNRHWTVVGSADFDRDNQPDLLFQHSASTSLALWLMDGISLRQATWIPPLPLTGSPSAALPR
jgi:hypothetical protein